AVLGPQCLKGTLAPLALGLSVETWVLCRGATYPGPSSALDHFLGLSACQSVRLLASLWCPCTEMSGISSWSIPLPLTFCYSWVARMQGPQHSNQEDHGSCGRARGAIAEKEAQGIPLDIPGLIRPKGHLELSLLEDPWKSMESADLVVVLVNVSYSEPAQLSAAPVLDPVLPVPSILVMNKVVALKQKSVLELTSALPEGVVSGKKLKIRRAFHSHLGTHYPSLPAKSPGTQSWGTPQGIDWPHFQELLIGVLTCQMPEKICASIIGEKLLGWVPLLHKVAWEGRPSREQVILPQRISGEAPDWSKRAPDIPHCIGGRDLMGIFLCKAQSCLSVGLLK
ncbi:LOW QUALITY PROTEIN: GTPase Era, mitochondrial, partial [Galemys pyrenaicus]